MKFGRRGVVFIVIAGIAVAVASSVARIRSSRPMNGTVERAIAVGTETRTYLLHAGGPAKPGRPLVFVLHGLGGTATAFERRTHGTFNALADRDGAVVVYPQGSGQRPHWGTWRPGAPGAPPPPDDLGFLSTLVDALAAELSIDRNRIYATGFSQGATMVYRLACERPDMVAAVAPVSGGMVPDDARACAQGPPVSIAEIHGTADPVVPLDQAVRDSVAAWAKRDGCPAQPATSQLPDIDPDDGTRTRVDVFCPCAAGNEVAFYTIDGGGHTWPGEDPPFFRRRGNTSRDFDAAVVIWDFFQRHAQPAQR